MSALPWAFVSWLVMWGVLFQPADDLVPGYWEQTPLPLTGQATYYAPGLMEYVEGVRLDRGQLPDCPECVGRVALLRAGDIGRRVWLQPPGEEGVGPFLVIDCAHLEDVAPLLERSWAVDVSYELGQLWGMDGPLEGVTVYADPADVGPSIVRGPPTPFVVDPGAVVISPPTATPAATPARPTPWPTRLPRPLGARAEAPAEAVTPAGPALPTPLTPVITTPTPRGGAARTTTPAARSSATPQPFPAGPTEVAVGRPGRELLLATATPAAEAARVAPTVRSRPSPTAGASPTPILRGVSPAGAPLPAASERRASLLARLWSVFLAWWGSLFGGTSR